MIMFSVHVVLITLKMMMLFVNVILKFSESQKGLRLLLDFLFSYFEN